LTPVSIPYRVSQGPASESTYDAYIVPPGRRLRLKEIEAIFPSGVGGYLQLAVYHGIRRIAPEDGAFQLDEGRAVARLRYEFISGERVKVWAKNTHATSTFSASLLMEGELE